MQTDLLRNQKIKNPRTCSLVLIGTTLMALLCLIQSGCQTVPQANSSQTKPPPSPVNREDFKKKLDYYIDNSGGNSREASMVCRAVAVKIYPLYELASDDFIRVALMIVDPICMQAGLRWPPPKEEEESKKEHNPANGMKS